MFRSTFAFAAAAALAATGAPAFAADVEAPGNGIATAPGSSAPTSASGREKRYCFMAEQTASRIPMKICKTKKEWEAEGVEIPAGR